MDESRAIVYILSRLNVKAVSLLIAGLLAIGGVLLVYLGIRDEGTIDIKTAVMEGKLKSGFVGIIIVFMSMIICVFCIVFPSRKAYTIEIKKGNLTVKWVGTSRTVGAKVIEMIESLGGNGPKQSA